jgi:hypothetical protein
MVGAMMQVIWKDIGTYALFAACAGFCLLNLYAVI